MKHAQEHHDHAAHGHEHGADTAAMEAIDPVCGMRVDPATALAHRHGDETYYFCNSRCRDKFVAEPARYIEPEKPTEPKLSAAAGTWACRWRSVSRIRVCG